MCVLLDVGQIVQGLLMESNLGWIACYEDGLYESVGFLLHRRWSVDERTRSRGQAMVGLHDGWPLLITNAVRWPLMRSTTAASETGPVFESSSVHVLCKIWNIRQGHYYNDGND